MKRHVLIGCLVCLLVTNIVYLMPQIKADNKIGYLFLIDPAHSEYLQQVPPMVDIKTQQGFDVRAQIFPKDKEYTPDNIRNFLRELKIGIPENKPPVAPTWPELKYIVLIGEFPMKAIMKNPNMNPAYFGDKDTQETDIFYCFLQDKIIDFDGAKIRFLWDKKPDVFIGRILALNDKVIKNFVESQKVIYYNPKISFFAPESLFPWLETEQKGGNGADWSDATEESAEKFRQLGFNVYTAYQTLGDKRSKYTPTEQISRLGFETNFPNSHFTVTLSSDESGNYDFKKEKPLCINTQWNDTNGDKLLSKSNQTQKNELQIEVLAELSYLNRIPNMFGRIWLSFFWGVFSLTSDNVILNEKSIAMITEHGMRFVSDCDTPRDGWHIGCIYLLLQQINNHTSIGEAVFSLPFEYGKFTKVKSSGWANWEAWTVASFVVLGDPSYRPLDHLRPYSIQVPEKVDMKYQTKVNIKIMNLSDQNKKVNLFAQDNWLKINVSEITLKPKEEKMVEIQIQTEFSSLFRILRTPINKYGEISVETENEKPQKIKVMAKM